MEVAITKPSFNKYPAYKESGVDWLGEIPESWEILPGLSFITEGKDKNKGMKRDTVLSLSYGNIRVKGDDELTGLVPESFETYQLVNKGDVIFRPTDLQNDKVSLRSAISNYEGIITSAYLNLRIKEKASSKFYHYLLRAIDANKVIYGLGSGLRQNISYLDFRRFLFPFPPKDEQAAIANFLDDKTAKIDRAIAQKEQLITLLKERKQIIIQNAVTKGLDPNVQLKDSGVEWIGEIPEHWEVWRSKFLFSQRKERARKNDIQLSATQKYGVISQEKYESLSGKRVVKLELHLEKRKHVELGDFIISMRSFQGGLERAWEQGCIRSSYVVLKPSFDVDPDYFAYLLKSERYIRAIQSTAGFIRDGQDLSFDNFSKVDLFLPPKSEQKAISEFIESVTEKMEECTSLQKKQIEKLKEYKATLIDSAVTGKIKVTESQHG